MDDTLEVLNCLEQIPMEFEPQPPINDEYAFLAGMISDADQFYKSQSVHEQERNALEENISSLKTILQETQQNLERERQQRLQIEVKLRGQIELNEDLNNHLINTKLREEQSTALVEEKFTKQTQDMIQLLKDVTTAYLLQYDFLRHRRVFKHKIRLSWPLINNKIAANEYLEEIFAEHEERALKNPGPELKDVGVNCNFKAVAMKSVNTNTDDVVADPVVKEKPKEMVDIGINTIAPNRVTRSTQVTEKKEKMIDRSTMCTILDCQPPVEEESMDIDEIFSTTICVIPPILEEIEELVMPKVSASCQTDDPLLGVSTTATGSLTELNNISQPIDYVRPTKRGRQDLELIKRELSTERDLFNRPEVDGISNQFEQYWAMAGRSLLAMLETKPKNETLEVDIFTGALFHQQMVAKILQDAPVKRAVSIPSVYSESTKSGYEKDAIEEDENTDFPRRDPLLNSEDSLEPPQSFRRICEDFLRDNQITRPSSVELPIPTTPVIVEESLTTEVIVQSNEVSSKADRKAVINRTVNRILRDRSNSYKMKRPLSKVGAGLRKVTSPLKRTRVAVRQKDNNDDQKVHLGMNTKSLLSNLFGSDSEDDEDEKIEEDRVEGNIQEKPTRDCDNLDQRTYLNEVIFGPMDQIAEEDELGVFVQKDISESPSLKDMDEQNQLSTKLKSLNDLLFGSDTDEEDMETTTDDCKRLESTQQKDDPLDDREMVNESMPSIENVFPEPNITLTSEEELQFFDFDSPKSPLSLDSEATSQEPPRNIPVEREANSNKSGVMRELKLTHTTINQFLQNYSQIPEKPKPDKDMRKPLITNAISDYLNREWTTASVDQCVNNLREIVKEDSTTNLLLVKCMLEIIGKSRDDLHFEPFNCLAPFMPQTHQMIVLLVTRFNLGKLMIDEIERCLFTLQDLLDVSTIINWTYLYLTLQDLEINMKRPGDKVPLRLFMAKAFYYHRNVSLVIVYMTLKAFPKLLPRILDDRPFVLGQSRDPLVDVLICILMNPNKPPAKISSVPNKVNEIRNDLQKLLNSYYRYKAFQPKPQEVVTMLMEKLKTPGRDLNVVHGFLILAKHFNCEWTMTEILQKEILPRTDFLMNTSGAGPLSLITGNELCLCFAVIAGLVKVFPRESNVSSYRDIFRKALENHEKYSHRIQECAVISLIRLCAFGTDEAFKAIRNWYAPAENISPYLRAVLESFVRRRKPKYWIELSNGV